MIGVVIVLFVNVSVPANVANVPVVGNVIFVAAVLVNVEAKAPDITNAALVGIVNVPVVVDIVKPLIVLFVNVSVPAKVANVPATVGIVIATAVVLFPTNDILPSVVTVVWSPNVKVALFVGWVTNTLFMDVAVATPNVGVVKVGEVNVLLVNVSVPSKVANVPATVGKVIATAVVLFPINDILPAVVTVV
jgi:hypothetical protein